MAEYEPSRNLKAAVEEFQKQAPRRDASALVASLDRGLALTRDLLYRRFHADVQILVGRDSMLMPVSERKTRRKAMDEIAVYQCVESAETASGRHYLAQDDTWYLSWLLRFQAAEHAEASKRAARYRPLPFDQRRLEFSNILATALPESRQSPLVLLRLFPLAIAVVTSVAFEDHEAAQEARTAQLKHLLAIGDCPLCQGAILENGESCDECGNPVWKFAWLTAD